MYLIDLLLSMSIDKMFYMNYFKMLKYNYRFPLNFDWRLLQETRISLTVQPAPFRL